MDAIKLREKTQASPLPSKEKPEFLFLFLLHCYILTSTCLFGSVFSAIREAAVH